MTVQQAGLRLQKREGEMIWTANMQRSRRNKFFEERALTTASGFLGFPGKRWT